MIIAEIGSTHDGSFGNAKRLIETAAECGVDVVKFQTHIAEAETLPSAPTPNYFQDESRIDYFKRTAFSIEQWISLKRVAEDNELIFLSSPFSVKAVELLENINISHYKIPSGEVTNLPMLEVIGKTGKPVLLSSGMSTWNEIDEAVDTIRAHHNNIILLQCTSEYPVPYERVGLNVMLQMKNQYNLPVGLSDHTLTNYAAYAAVVLGASVIEKHFTLSKDMYGSDARHSITPEEMSDLVRGIRAIETMLTSDVDKDDISRLENMKNIFEKSVVSIVDIKKGTVITENMLGIKKPGTGIPGKYIEKVIGRTASRQIPKDSLILDEFLEK